MERGAGSGELEASLSLPGETMRQVKKGNKPRENAPRIRWTRRILRRMTLPAGMGTLAVVALMVLTGPMVAATAGGVSFGAPYKGATAVHIRDPTVQGCGATLSVPVPAAFALATGKATGQASAKSGACASSDSQATYDGTMGLTGLSFTAAKSGTFSLVAHWAVTWNAGATMNSAAAGAGSQATIEIFLVAKLTDVTSGITKLGTTVFIVQKDLQSATSYTNGATNAAYKAGVNGVSLIAGHVYHIYAVISFSAQVAVPQGSPSASWVSANVDLGSAGHGGYLRSITVA